MVHVRRRSLHPSCFTSLKKQCADAPNGIAVHGSEVGPEQTICCETTGDGKVVAWAVGQGKKCPYRGTGAPRAGRRAGPRYGAAPDWRGGARPTAWRSHAELVRALLLHADGGHSRTRPGSAPLRSVSLRAADEPFILKRIPSQGCLESRLHPTDHPVTKWGT